jgi:hypothetical protein
VLFHTPRLKPEENSPREPLGLKAELPRMNAGAPTPDINGAKDYGLAPSQCFEGTSFSRFSLAQNARPFGGSNQGWMKSDESIPISLAFVARRLSRMHLSSSAEVVREIKEQHVCCTFISPARFLLSGLDLRSVSLTATNIFVYICFRTFLMQDG